MGGRGEEKVRRFYAERDQLEGRLSMGPTQSARVVVVVMIESAGVVVCG